MGLERRFQLSREPVVNWPSRSVDLVARTLVADYNFRPAFGEWLVSDARRPVARFRIASISASIFVKESDNELLRILNELILNLLEEELEENVLLFLYLTTKKKKKRNWSIPYF